MKKLAVAVAAALLLLSAYPFFLEPRWIQLTRHELTGKVGTPIRIAHLSDLHTRDFGYRERKVLSLLEKEKPDLIVITGDSISDKQSYAEVRELLSHLKAALGVLLVRGNWEHWRPHPGELDAYRDAGVRFLNNSALRIRDDFWVVGIDDSFAGKPDLSAALQGVPAGVFRLGLFHSPDFFDSTGSAFDLVLSGHTHGGQVRLPFWGPIFLPPHSGRFDNGLYEREHSRMYVSRGIGTSILDVRFLCRPELPIIEIRPR